MPRLTGFSVWAPCQSPRNPDLLPEDLSCSSPSEHQLQILARLGRTIQRQAADQPSGKTLHAVGVWHLLWSDSSAEAVTHLESAAELEQGLPDIWADLAAAYLIRAGQQQRPADLVRAIAAADRALRTTPWHRAALFNKAIALDFLFMKPEAEDIWKELLRAEELSMWRQEIRERLTDSAQTRPVRWEDSVQELWPDAAGLDSIRVREITAAFPMKAQQHAQEEQLGNWARQFKMGSSDTDGIEAARAIADSLFSVAGDPILLGEIDAIERAAKDRSNPERLEDLAAGYSIYRDARVHYRNFEIERAADLFAQARVKLRSGESPLELWASYYAAVCQYYDEDDEDLDGAQEAFASLNEPAARGGHKILHGHLSWMMGLIAASQNRFDESLLQYSNSIDHLEQSNLRQEAAFVRVLMAETLLILNDQRSAWNELHRALSEADQWTSHKLLRSMFDLVAEAARSLGELEASTYFQNRSLQAAIASKQPTIISEAYYERSQVFLRLGQVESAFVDVTEARRWLDRTPDSTARRVSEAGVLITEARLAREPDRALEQLASAIRELDERGAEALLPGLLLEQARMLIEEGRDPEAEDCLRRAIAVIGKASQGIHSGHQRSTFLTTVREIYDEMIRFQVRVNKNPWHAFEFAEMARAQEYLEPRLASESSIPMPSLQGVQANLGQGAVLLSYRVLDDRLLIWIIQAQTEAFEVVLLEAGELTFLTEKLLRSLRTRAPEETVRHWGALLYELLIMPAVDQVDGASLVLLAPDRDLFGIPFGTLFDASTQRFLAETHGLAKTLGMAIPSNPTERRRNRSISADSSILVVADPRFETSRFPYLAPLPAARREAMAVLELFPGAELYLGAEATRTMFLEHARNYEVLHYAGHALANHEYPELSFMALASEPDESAAGTLYARDIESMVLGKNSLVVLSACETVIHSTTRTSGVAGLARAFLSAGAPTVLATLWPVGDQEGMDMTARFYFHLQLGLEPTEALRRAQTEILGSDKTASTALHHHWSAYELYVATTLGNTASTSVQ